MPFRTIANANQIADGVVTTPKLAGALRGAGGVTDLGATHTRHLSHCVTTGCVVELTLGDASGYARGQKVQNNNAGGGDQGDDWRATVLETQGGDKVLVELWFFGKTVDTTPTEADIATADGIHNVDLSTTTTISAKADLTTYPRTDKWAAHRNFPGATGYKDCVIRPNVDDAINGFQSIELAIWATRTAWVGPWVDLPLDTTIRSSFAVWIKIIDTGQGAGTPSIDNLTVLAGDRDALGADEWGNGAYRWYLYFDEAPYLQANDGVWMRAIFRRDEVVADSGTPTSWMTGSANEDAEYTFDRISFSLYGYDVVELECDADVSDWAVGETVQNDTGDGDDWVGEILAVNYDRDDIYADDSQVLLVKLTTGDLSDINLGDGIENATDPDTAGLDAAAQHQVLIRIGGIASEAPSHPILILGGDGPYQSVIDNMLPVMETYGWKGVAWGMDRDATHGDAPDDSRRETVAAAGWDMASHGGTVTGYADATTYLQQALIETSAVKCYVTQQDRDCIFHSWLHNNGYCNAVGTRRMREMLLALGFIASRGRTSRGDRQNNGTTTSVHLTNKPEAQAPFDWMNLPFIAPGSLESAGGWAHDGGGGVPDRFYWDADDRVDSEDPTAPANFQEALDIWLKQGRMAMIVYCHRVVETTGDIVAPGDITIDFMHQIFDWVRDNEYDPDTNPTGVEVIRLSDWYSRVMGRGGAVRQGYDDSPYLTDGAGTTVRMSP